MEEQEEKLKNLESQNMKLIDKNQNLFQELLKSRDREQNIERFFFIILSCLGQSGLNIFGNCGYGVRPELMLNAPNYGVSSS